MSKASFFCLATMILLVSSCTNDVHALSSPHVSSRRQWFQAATAAAASAFVVTSTPAGAAPPIAIMAEQLGYFPVTNKKGQTVYVAKRVQRASSEQAIALAQHLRDNKAKVYETYWCPHSARQRELFGREAWAMLDKVECSPKGYQGKPGMCNSAGVDGYPTWKIRGKLIGGERPLSALAEASGFPGKFDEDLEQNVPPALGSSACK